MLKENFFSLNRCAKNLARSFGKGLEGSRLFEEAQDTQRDQGLRYVERVEGRQAAVSKHFSVPDHPST